MPGAVWGNRANRTKSDSVTAISRLFLSDPLTLPCPPGGFGASLALPGAQGEDKTQSGGLIPVLALLLLKRTSAKSFSFLGLSFFIRKFREAVGEEVDG